MDGWMHKQMKETKLFKESGKSDRFVNKETFFGS